MTRIDTALIGVLIAIVLFAITYTIDEVRRIEECAAAGGVYFSREQVCIDVGRIRLGSPK